MVTWDYLPDIRFGQEQTLRLGFEKIVDGMFLRLVYTDFPTTNPDVADFDGDGWTNLEEVVLYGTSPFDYDPAGPDSGGGQPGGGDPDVPLAQFELEVFTTVNGAPQTPTRLRLDSGFNTITDGGFYVDGGVPSISVSRSNEVVTEIKLTDLTGGNRGATLNYLQLQKDKHPTDPAQPDITSMVNGWSLTIPEAQGGVTPIPFDSFTLPGDLPPAEAGSTTDWLLKPMDLTVAFGIGPSDGNSQGIFDQGMQARLAANPPAPAPADTVNFGPIWGVRGLIRPTSQEIAAAAANGGPAPQPQEKIYALEVYSAQDPLDRSLQSKERIAIFDGHSNFGLGPNFEEEAIKNINDFANYGVGLTDIPSDFRGVNNAIVMPDPNSPPGTDSYESQRRLGLEGWSYVVADHEIGQNGAITVTPMDIHGNLTNYIPLDNLNPTPTVGLRYSETGVPNNGQIIQIPNPEPHHYTTLYQDFFGNQQTKYHAMIPAHGNIGAQTQQETKGADVPDLLQYKTFFFNACSRGKDYIQNFQHGDFVYTTRTCVVSIATLRFVDLTIDGRETNFIVNNMNTNSLGGPGPISYRFHDFSQN